MTAKRDKTQEFEEISKKIQEGELEVVPFSGISDAWKIFNKIRSVKEPAKYIDYVRCKKCKQIRTFKPQNGVSTLTKHECKNKENDEEVIFKDISADKAKEIKANLLLKSIELCSNDILSPEIFSGPGFLKYAQYLVALGQQEGCVNLQNLLPNTSVICRTIQTFKEEETQTIEQNLMELIRNEYCSLTMNSNTTIDGDVKLTVSIIYFNADVTELAKKVIFTVSADDCTQKTMFDMLKTFGCDEKTLKSMVVVTPKNKLFTEIIGQMCPKLDCVASVITSVLKPFSDNKEISGVIVTCRAILNHLIETENITKLSFAVAADNGTWKGKFNMIKTLNEHYNEVMNIMGNEIQNDFKYNKKLAEELIAVLEIFIEAVDSLQSNGVPTLNKILPWWSVLQDHLNTSEKRCTAVKRSMKFAQRLFRMEFAPTMKQKVACFLDPRYRLLKMISADERNEVIIKVKLMLENLHVIPTVPVANVPPNPPAKKGKFSHLEASDDDVEARDEVSRYVHSTESTAYNFAEPRSEFDIVGKFWKDNKAKLPKLYLLATTTLHTPACCCSSEGPLNSSKILDPEILDNLLFLRDKLSNIR